MADCGYCKQLGLTANSIEVENGSSIDISAGVMAGAHLGDTTEGASTYYAGGSYGGLGGASGTTGVPNDVYGDFTNPAELGSGAAPYIKALQTEPHPGRLIRITADTMILNGSLTANGSMDTTRPWQWRWNKD